MPSKKKDTDALEPGGGNVEQIREILFGGHLRAFDERFDLVESRLAKETDVLRKALDKKLDDLERQLQAFREEANDRLGEETNGRELALNKFELALGQSRVDTENQIAAIEDRSASGLKEIRAEIKASNKALTAALAKADRELRKISDKLDQDKVARADLANFFKDLAQQLQPEKTSRGK